MTQMTASHKSTTEILNLAYKPSFTFKAEEKIPRNCITTASVGGPTEILLAIPIQPSLHPFPQKGKGFSGAIATNCRQAKQGCLIRYALTFVMGNSI